MTSIKALDHLRVLDLTRVLADEDLERIVRMTASGDKHLHLFNVDVVDEEGLVVAKVEKIVYVRRKRKTS
jgi:hypothetical protein